MNETKTKFLFLQLFADGGAEGTATGTESGDNGADAAPQSGESKLPITFLDEERPATENPDAEDSQNEAEEPDLDAEFSALIKKGGKFNEQFEKRFRSALDGRMKGSREQAEKLEKSQKILQKLATIYGKDVDDFDGLEAAISNDSAIYESAAEAAGMDTNTFKTMVDVRSENEVLKKAEAERVQRSEAEKTYRGWMNEAEQLKGVYPDFDLEAEIQNPVFSSLLRNGFSVKNAFESAHHEEIVRQAMTRATQQAQINFSKNIAANQARPDENAASRNATATVTRDVASLTDEELDEIDELSRKRLITLG